MLSFFYFLKFMLAKVIREDYYGIHKITIASKGGEI
jgi:hypothetical protein